MDEVDDGVDEPRRVAHEDAGPGLAKLLGDSVVVRHRRDSQPHVLRRLRRLDALVPLARVERDVEVRRVSERLVALEPAEDDDIVASADPLPDTLTRSADEPEPRLGCARMNLLPELEQVVDVVERLLAVSVLCRSMWADR